MNYFRPFLTIDAFNSLIILNIKPLIILFEKQGAAMDSKDVKEITSKQAFNIKKHPENQIKQSYFVLTNLYVIKDLSKRERACMRLMLMGYSTRMIAQKLFISSRTVESMLESLRDKLNCASKFDVFMFALENGLLLVPEF